MEVSYSFMKFDGEKYAPFRCIEKTDRENGGEVRGEGFSASLKSPDWVAGEKEDYVPARKGIHMRVKTIFSYCLMGLSTLAMAQEPPIDIGAEAAYNTMTTFVPKYGWRKNRGKSLQLVLKYTKDGGLNTQM